MDGQEAAAPQTTADIAASVITEAEQQDTATVESAGETTETRVDTTNTAEIPSPQPKTEPTPAELSAAAKFLLKQGHKLKKDDGRDVWLPAKTVEGMLDRYVDEHRGTWTGEKNAIETRAKELQQHIDAFRTAVSGDPKAFLSELAGVDPRYQAFLEQKQEERREIAEAANDPMPPPDYDLGNGQRTYSIDGLKQLREWDKRQLKRELAAEMDQRFKPLQEREQQAKERERQDQLQQEIATSAKSQIVEAQNWPLFGKLAEDGSLTEFQQAVLDELKQDTDAAQKAGQRPRLTLEGAYIRVASKRMTEDDTKRRERLLKEIQNAPKSTALPRQSTDAPRTQGPRSTTDITRSVIAKLEAGA
jgi:hypothetical protein